MSGPPKRWDTLRNYYSFLFKPFGGPDKGRFLKTECTQQQMPCAVQVTSGRGIRHECQNSLVVGPQRIVFLHDVPALFRAGTTTTDPYLRRECLVQDFSCKGQGSLTCGDRQKNIRLAQYPRTRVIQGSFEPHYTSLTQTYSFTFS